MTETQKLIDHSYSVRKRFLGMYRKANAGHIGCSLSCADILVYLKFGWMVPGDTFVMSKGHAAAALYSVLAEEGILSDKDIDTFYKNGTVLSAHPPVNRIPGIPFATGSLGHGLSLTAGMALGARLKNDQRRFFCLTSDGELDEGSVWEAALFLAQHRLQTVTWLIDRNGIQGIGKTEEVMALEPLGEKLASFGFHVHTADGHSFTSLEAARGLCEREAAAQNRPGVIICSTVKGHGVSYMQDTVDCHYLPMNEAQYTMAIDELEAWYRTARGGGKS